ncbi:hypothetical protein THAOC_10742, partial [Thalassiosira oceanica]
SPISSRMVNSLPTSASALSLQDPNQSTTQRLNRAGLVVDRFFHSPPLGFIVNTTWRLRCTIDVKRRYNSSSLSIITPSRAAESRQALISAVYSSPSNRPGTSPLASTAFHSFKEATSENITLIENEADLFTVNTDAFHHTPQIFVEVFNVVPRVRLDLEYRQPIHPGDEFRQNRLPIITSKQ